MEKNGSGREVKLSAWFGILPIGSLLINLIDEKGEDQVVRINWLNWRGSGDSSLRVADLQCVNLPIPFISSSRPSRPPVIFKVTSQRTLATTKGSFGKKNIVGGFKISSILSVTPKIVVKIVCLSRSFLSSSVRESPRILPSQFACRSDCLASPCSLSK